LTDHGVTSDHAETLCESKNELSKVRVRQFREFTDLGELGNLSTARGLDVVDGHTTIGSTGEMVGLLGNLYSIRLRQSNMEREVASWCHSRG
jgi:hypothetical protein